MTTVYNRITTPKKARPILVVSPYETLGFKVSLFWTSIMYFVCFSWQSSANQTQINNCWWLKSGELVGRSFLYVRRISAINCHQVVNLRLFCKTPKKIRKKPNEENMKPHSSHLPKIQATNPTVEEINESYPVFIHHSFISLMMSKFGQLHHWIVQTCHPSKLPQKMLVPSGLASSPDVNPIEP